MVRNEAIIRSSGWRAALRLSFFLTVAVAMGLYVSGCTTAAGTGTAVGAGTGAGLGALLGGIIGHQSGHTGAGVAIGSVVGGATGAGAGYVVGSNIDKNRQQDAAINQAQQDANTQFINVRNSNGSITPVRLVRQGNLWVGPRGETYTALPTEEQLRPIYGF